MDTTKNTNHSTDPRLEAIKALRTQMDRVSGTWEYFQDSAAGTRVMIELGEATLEAATRALEAAGDWDKAKPENNPWLADMVEKLEMHRKAYDHDMQMVAKSEGELMDFDEAIKALGGYTAAD